VNRDKTGDADGMNPEVDSRDEVMHICDFQGDDWRATGARKSDNS